MALILVDRDGVLNEDRPDSVKTPEELVLYSESISALARLKKAGHHIAMVTNQSILGKKVISWDKFDQIQGKLLTALAHHNAYFDRIYVAPDAPWEASHRRKPGAGMILEALTDTKVAASETPMVGDALRDLQAAFSAGCPRVLVRSGKGQKTEKDPALQNLAPVAIYDHFSDFVEAYLKNPQNALFQPPTLIPANETV